MSSVIKFNNLLPLGAILYWQLSFFYFCHCYCVTCCGLSGCI